MNCPHCHFQIQQPVQSCPNCSAPLGDAMRIAHAATVQDMQGQNPANVILSIVGWVANFMLQIVMMTLRLLVDVINAIF